jgi:hypothetical protein
MMDGTQVIGGVTAGRQARRMRGRRPKTDDSGRPCSVEGCRTRLSRYNRSDVCFAHRETRYPRIRAPRVSGSG